MNGYNCNGLVPSDNKKYIQDIFYGTEYKDVNKLMEDVGCKKCHYLFNCKILNILEPNQR